MHSKSSLHSRQRSVWALIFLAPLGLGASACAGRTQTDPDSGAPLLPATSGGATSTGGRSSGAGAGAVASGAGSNVGSAGSGTGSTGGLGELPLTQCTNGLDDDGDGLVDGFDAECTGALDNDEGTFATGIPGDNRDPKWQDCFFDGNSGAGDDGCRYNTGCLTGELPSDSEDCALSQACLDFCAPLTPSGCDCFGCCSVVLGSGAEINVQIGASCSLEKVLDEAACPVCQKSTQCENDCGKCDLCAGKTADDLDPSCTPAPPPPDSEPPSVPPPSHTCESGQAQCGEGLPACGGSEYCLQGCCVLSIR